MRTSCSWDRKNQWYHNSHDIWNSIYLLELFVFNLLTTYVEKEKGFSSYISWKRPIRVPKVGNLTILVWMEYPCHPVPLEYVSQTVSLERITYPRQRRGEVPLDVTTGERIVNTRVSKNPPTGGRPICCLRSHLFCHRRRIEGFRGPRTETCVVNLVIWDSIWRFLYKRVD